MLALCEAAPSRAEVVATEHKRRHGGNGNSTAAWVGALEGEIGYVAMELRLLTQRLEGYLDESASTEAPVEAQ